MLSSVWNGASQDVLDVLGFEKKEDTDLGSLMITCKLYVEQHGFALLTFTWTECMSHESFTLECLLSVCQRGIDAWPLIAAVKVLALHSLC